MENYKVIVWGLGHVGKAAVRQLVQRKSLELVAVYDTDEAKIGQDAGTLSGVEATGILVSGDADAVLAMDADIVLYYAPNFFDEGKKFHLKQLHEMWMKSAALWPPAKT